jgi:hypothetical protein
MQLRDIPRRPYDEARSREMAARYVESLGNDERFRRAAGMLRGGRAVATSIEDAAYKTAEGKASPSTIAPPPRNGLPGNGSARDSPNVLTS